MNSDSKKKSNESSDRTKGSNSSPTPPSNTGGETDANNEKRSTKSNSNDVAEPEESTYRNPPALDIEIPPGVDPIWFESYLSTRRSGIYDVGSQHKRRPLKSNKKFPDGGQA